MEFNKINAEDRTYKQGGTTASNLFCLQFYPTTKYICIRVKFKSNYETIIVNNLIILRYQIYSSDEEVDTFGLFDKSLLDYIYDNPINKMELNIINIIIS